jgi:hypothetical protein
MEVSPTKTHSLLVMTVTMVHIILLMVTTPHVNDYSWQQMNIVEEELAL